MTDKAAQVPPTRSLHRKLAQVMYEAERIPKNGIGPKEQGSYPFVRAGDAADYIRKALAEKVITMMPTSVQVTGQSDRLTANGKTMTTVDLITEWTLTDGESGETITIMSYGAGADTGDKYSGKASTSAMKYALLTGFLLSTGDDTENADTSDRRPKDVEKPTAATDPNAPDVVSDGDEEAEFMGNLKKVGSVVRGGATMYKAEFHQTPEGHAFGFRLKLAGEERDIPQVLVTGAYGDALFLAYVGEAAGLLGAHVTVKGRLYNVRQKGRTTYYRLVIGETDHDLIETPVVRIPALDPAEEADPTEAPTAPLFELDDAEKTAVGGGMPS